MTDRSGMDPLEELRRANPVDSDRLPSASLARFRARVLEDTTMGLTDTPAPKRNPFSRVLGGGLVAAALVVLAVFVAPKALGPTPGPTASDPLVGGGGIARCVENYNLDTLRNRDFAFAGTVLSITGHEVTFQVDERFSGSGGDQVTLTAEGMTGTTVTSAGGPNLAVGNRYLVAGNDQFAWPCGFTQEYNAGVAAQWADALDG